MKNTSDNNLIARTLLWLVILIGAITALFWLLSKLPVGPQAFTPTPPVANSTVGAQLLHADFEQPGVISGTIGNSNSGDWSTKVVDGNGLLVVRSASNGGPGTLPLINYGSGAWTNYVLSFRFKVTECNPNDFFGCTIIITFRNENDQCYVLTINTNAGEVMLSYGDRDNWKAINNGVTNIYHDLPLGTWHDVLLTADREFISVSVDGKQVVSATDNRLKTGSVGIIVGASTTAEFDDINVWDIPSNTPVMPSQPSESPSAQLAVKPTSEFVPGAQITYQTSFADAMNWHAGGTTDINNNLLIVQGKSSGITHSAALGKGDGIIALFRCASGTNANIVLDNGGGGNSYKYVGIQFPDTRDFTVSLGYNGGWSGGQQLNGNLRFVVDHWYYALIEIRDGGLFYLKVWDKDNPDSYRDKLLPMGKEWENMYWNGYINTNQYNTGQIEVKYYEEFHITAQP